MKAYKLTDHNSQTHNNTQWGENVTHSAKGNTTSLCSNSWIHFYTSPYIAVLLNPRHANFSQPQLWECETSGEHKHEALKSGCKILTTLKQIELPSLTVTQKIKFAILCAKEVTRDTKWNKWADNWLNNVDRSKKAALAQAAGAYVHAAYAYVAYTYVAYAHAAYAAYVAAHAALAHAYAHAYAAAAAVYAAADTRNTQSIDFNKIALLVATDSE